MSVSDLVGEIEGVRRRTRRASAGAAVPLALLGLLVVGAAPVYALASDSSVITPGEDGYGAVQYVGPMEPPSLLDRLLWVHTNGVQYRGIGIYWLVAAPLVFAAIAYYYRRRAQRTGLSLNGGRVAAVGAAAFAALVVTFAFGAWSDYGWGFDRGMRAGDFVNPFLVVGLGVFTLAWVERSVLTALTGVAYAGWLVLAQHVTFSTLSNPGWEYLGSWGPMIVFLGLVPLIGAGVVGLVQRARARRA